MKLRIKPFSDEVAKLYRNHGHFHRGDAGLDLFVVEETTIEPGETKPIHHKISCESVDDVPYFLIPRSSISKTPLRMSNSIGLIDGGYRGEIIAYCDNIKGTPYTVKPGQRLFQLVAIDGSPIEIEIVEFLNDSARGYGGFGSTGL
ncbi:MAG: dUTP diphosphatase [Candidatus Marinimicrobia bacterium]|nr:dUTP diphosphatase [Candidatus Neomarinimicrobiota bacterium]